MEKQSKKLDASLKRIVSEGGLEKPSFDFANSVLTKVEAKKTKAYAPLITKTGWVLIAFCVGVIVFGLIYVSGGESFTIKDIPYLSRYSNFNFEWPHIQFSMVTTIAIACSALFLLEIPFLKNYLERQFK